MNSQILELLLRAAQAVDPACVGCAMLDRAQPVEPEWVVVDRADGRRVRVDGVAADSPAVEAVRGADVSSAAVAANDPARQRVAAVEAFLTSNDPTIVAARALFRLAFTWINDEREARGAARILERDIIALAMSGTINDGLGDAPAGVNGGV